MAASRDVPARVIAYDAMTGAISFRRALAALLEQRLLGRPVDPDHIITLAGSGAVLETLFYAIADPGEGVLVPTPSYSGFWPDLETRDGLSIIAVPTPSSSGFTLTVELLEAAAAAATVPVRALLLPSPDNPLGRVHPAGTIDAILEWAERRDLHVVFDELFALSVYGDSRFVSAATRRPSLGDRLHIVWAFSKDFAASGLRCGVLISENEDVLAAVDGLAVWAAVSGDTQYLLEQLIADDAWVDGFLAENRRRLGDAYRQVTAALDAATIPFLPAEAGFFFLCDLRGFLDSPTWEAEAALWERLLTEANVNLTPGSACRIGEPGFMRLCFASEPTEAVLAGIERMAGVLGAAPGPR
jgi:aspartate/methionine/tyrosine aminotransferase